MDKNLMAVKLAEECVKLTQMLKDEYAERIEKEEAAADAE